MGKIISWLKFDLKSAVIIILFVIIGSVESNPVSSSESNNDDDVCEQVPESSPCDNAIRQYYYDSGTNSCNTFDWCSSKGSKNHFDCESACLDQCQKGKKGKIIVKPPYPKPTRKPKSYKR